MNYRVLPFLIFIAIAVLNLKSGEPGHSELAVTPEANPHAYLPFPEMDTVWICQHFYYRPGVTAEWKPILQMQRENLIVYSSYQSGYFDQWNRSLGRGFISFNVTGTAAAGKIVSAEIEFPRTAETGTNVLNFRLHHLSMHPYSFQFGPLNPYWTADPYTPDPTGEQAWARWRDLGDGPILGEYSGTGSGTIRVPLNATAIQLLNSTFRCSVGIDNSYVSSFLANGASLTYDINVNTPKLKVRYALDPRELEDLANKGPVKCPPAVAGARSANQSWVDNTQLAHYHDATDYQIATPSSICSTCTVAANSSGTLPALKIDRVHRYRDIDFRSSFGPGVFMGYDYSLSLYPGLIQFFDPSNPIPINFVDNNADGVYNDEEQNLAKSVRLYDTNGLPTFAYGSAATAEVALHSGIVYKFQIFRTDSFQTSDYCGRLAQIKDRNNNAITINYTNANALATDAELDYDRHKLWRISTIVDAYGLTATFNYTRIQGLWCVSQIAVPNGSTIQYGYSDAGISGLSDITYPDGTKSEFRTRNDTQSKCQIVDYNDAGAEGIHRRKQVFFSKTQFGTSNQPSNRVRKVLNGFGECSYFNWTKSAGQTKTTFVYEGGGDGTGTLLRYETLDGVPSKTYRAITWSYSTAEATWTWELIADYTADSKLQVVSEKDSSNRRYEYDRDPTTGAITAEKLYTSTNVLFSTSSTQYNQFAQPTQETDRLNRITKYEYDVGGKGNLTKRTDAFGTAEVGIFQWTHNSKGQPLTYTDANGNVTNYYYDDPRGFLTKVVQPSDMAAGGRAETLYEHDSAGRLWHVTDPSGRLTTYS